MTLTDSEYRRAVTATRVAVALSIACVAWSATVGAQQVSLRIEPPVGETLRMRLDQRVEMSGTTRMGAGDSTATVVTTLLRLRDFVDGGGHLVCSHRLGGRLSRRGRFDRRISQTSAGKGFQG